MQQMFISCKSLTALDLSSFNTAKVKNMEGMFKSTGALTALDLSSFDTTSVTDMNGMFAQSGLVTFGYFVVPHAAGDKNELHVFCV